MKHLLGETLKRIFCKKEEKQKRNVESHKEKKYSPFPDIMIPEPKQKLVLVYIVFFAGSVISSVCYLSWRLFNIKQMVINRGSLAWWEIVGAFVRFLGEMIITCLAYIQTVYIVLLC